MFAYYLHALPLPLHRVATFVVLFSELIVPFGDSPVAPCGTWRASSQSRFALRYFFVANSGFWSSRDRSAAFVSTTRHSRGRLSGWYRKSAPEGPTSRGGAEDGDRRGVHWIARARRRAAARLWSPTLGGRASIEPFHLVNSYGAIEPVERQRDEVVFEGTWDDVALGDAHWVEYELPCKPGGLSRAPCFPHAAPAAPRSASLAGVARRFSPGAMGHPVVDDLLRENPRVTCSLCPRPLRASRRAFGQAAIATASPRGRSAALAARAARRVRSAFFR